MEISDADVLERDAAESAPKTFRRFAKKRHGSSEC
jgi:hypothetical protein